jgi:hypothetical protein
MYSAMRLVGSMEKEIASLDVCASSPWRSMKYTGTRGGVTIFFWGYCTCSGRMKAILVQCIKERAHTVRTGYDGAYTSSGADSAISVVAENRSFPNILKVPVTVARRVSDAYTAMVRHRPERQDNPSRLSDTFPMKAVEVDTAEADAAFCTF